MNPKRKSRLYFALFLLVAVGGAIAALMVAMQENLNMFYPPDQVVGGEAPVGRTIRAGGMVQTGSVERESHGLGVSFVLTDYKGADFRVRFEGILPDLFREGQGILVRGQLLDNGEFDAEEVLAKHDENYMPPELVDMGLKAGTEQPGG